MTVVIHTARVAYRGEDRLDVTRKSGREGLVFAPSWPALRPVLDVRAKHAAGCADDAELAVVWNHYVAVYTAEMRMSYRRHRAAWDALLARPVVTLCCYCTDPDHCHRTLLARDILPKLGATYGGER